MKNFCLIILMVIVSQNMFSQQETVTDNDKPLSFGFWGGLNITNHKADFYDLKPMDSYSTVDKQKFTGGTGFNPSFGLFANYRFGSSFVFELKAIYQPISIEMVTEAPIGLQEYQGKPIQLYSKKTLAPKLDALTIAPYFYYSPSVLPELKFGVSPEFSLLLGKTFSYKEELIGENGVQYYYFQDSEASTRDEIPEGTEIKDASSLSFNLAFELNYAFSLTENLEIIPSATFSIGLNDLAKDVSWKYNSFRFGIGFAYRPDFGSSRTDIECPEGYKYDDVLAKCIPNECPKGYKMNEQTGDCLKIECPPNYIFDEHLNECVEKTCPEGFAININTGDCERTCPEGFILNAQTKDCERTCPEGFVLNDKNECTSSTPDIVEGCKGNYIAISSFKTKADADNELMILNESGLTKIKVELLKDVVNPNNKFYTIVTGCFSSDDEALSSKREIANMLSKKGLIRNLEIRER